MECPGCHGEIPAGMRFCGLCGEPMPKIDCPHCTFINPPNFRFCGACGLVLSGATDDIPHDAERRQLTVMFCDLVGSTELSERLDPEELREVIAAYQAECTAVVVRYDAFIAQYLGDGILVYFGYPAAHGDDAVRAVRAGLDVLEALSPLRQTLQQRDIALSVRIGLHTGNVVIGRVGGPGRQELLALGDVPNIAARVQGEAERDTVAISAATARLSDHRFEMRGMGPRTLKGISHPIELFTVIAEHARDAQPDTPLVGREAELAALRAHWAAASRGRGQVVAVRGEAGIGKSRLVRALFDELRPEATTLWLEASPYARETPFLPMLRAARALLGLHEGQSADEQRELLRDRLAEADVALLAAALSIDGAPPGLSPQVQRRRTLELLVDLFTANTPLLAIAEDAHGMDPSSLEVLQLLAERGAHLPILVVATCRTHFDAPWLQNALTPSRLERADAGAIIREIAGAPLPAALEDMLVERCDGIPLYLEEVTRTVLESGHIARTAEGWSLSGTVPERMVPATLHGTLMARLDRLGRARELAQTGATIGREFSFELLSAVTSLERSLLESQLARLLAAGVLREHGRLPRSTYTFNHALVQELAYESLLKSTRHALHSRIADILVGRFPAVVEMMPELLAHHYAEAGRTEEAAAAWQRAGERSLARSANLEAIHDLERALALIGAGPSTPRSVSRRLACLTSLGVAQLMARGYAAPEVEHTNTLAMALCRQLPSSPQTFPVMWGLWAFYLVSGRIHRADELAAELDRVAAGDERLRMLAALAMGETDWWTSRPQAALTHLQTCCSLYDRTRDAELALTYGGADPAVTALANQHLLLLCLGRDDESQRKFDEVVEACKTLGQSYTETYGLAFAAVGAYLSDDAPRVRQLTARMIALSATLGFSLWLALGHVVEGWALARQGDIEAGTRLQLEGIGAYRASGAQLGVPCLLNMQADVHRMAGRIDEGLAAIDEALEMARNGDVIYEADSWRVRGLLQAERDRDAARESLRRAADIARAHGFVLFERRAEEARLAIWEASASRPS